MKKFMIAILLLIPLIVLLTISVSGAIISAEVSIDIETMQLMHNGEVVDVVDIKLEDYKATNKPYQLMVYYLPTTAQNNSMKWTSSDPAVATVNTDGVVRFQRGGKVIITATSNSNTQKTASCTFFVMGDVVDSLTLTAYNTNEKNITIKRYETLPLSTAIDPVSALGDNYIRFSSSNESILTVDSNGIVKAVGIGTAEISATAQGKKGNAVTTKITIKVEDENLCKAQVVYTSANTYNFADNLSSEGEGATLIAEKTAYFTGNILNLGEENEVLVEVRNYGLTEFVIVKKVEEHQLAFDTYGLEMYKWESDIYVNKDSGNTFLEVIATDGSSLQDETINWSSSNTDVLTIQKGRIFGHNIGVAVVTASIDGYVNATIEINVVANVDYFILDLSNEEDEVGLASERVFGAYTYMDGVVTNTLPIVIKATYPTDAKGVYTYYSSNNDYATVSQDGIVTFKEESIGKEVTIFVKSKYSTIASSESYTFHVVNGINFGLYVSEQDENGIKIYKRFGDNPYDAETKVEPSWQPFYDILYLMNEYREEYDNAEAGDLTKAVVFHTNVYVKAKSTEVKLYRCIYGNGYKYDGQFRTAADPSWWISTFQQDHPCELGRKCQEFFVENLSLQSTAPVTDDNLETYEDMCNGGQIVRFSPRDKDTFGEGENAHEGYRFRFSYCLFQYGYLCFSASGGIYIMEGCVFRNVAGAAFVIQSCPQKSLDLTIRNCIFSNLVGPALLSTCGDCPPPSKDPVTKFLTVRFEGENYVYNWKNMDELRMDLIPNSLFEQSLVESINKYLAGMIKEALEDPINEDILVHDVNTKTYFNFGFVFIGMWKNLNFESGTDRADYTEGVNVKGENYRVFDLNYENCLKDSAGLLVKTAIKNILYIDLEDPDMQSKIVTPVGSNGEYNTSKSDSYTLNKETLKKLHGEK